MRVLQHNTGCTTAASYDACFRGLLRSGLVAGLALLDAVGGHPLYENRIDERLLPRHRPPPPCCPPVTMRNRKEEGEEEKEEEERQRDRPKDYRCCCDGLVSPSEGRQLVAAVKGLTDDGLCRREALTCMGMPFRVFGGTPLGIYAVGVGRRTGLIARTLPLVGLLVVFYRRPHMPQQVVPCVENFVDRFWTDVQDFGSRLPHHQRQQEEEEEEEGRREEKG